MAELSNLYAQHLQMCFHVTLWRRHVIESKTTQHKQEYVRIVCRVGFLVAGSMDSGGSVCVKQQNASGSELCVPLYRIAFISKFNEPPFRSFCLVIITLSLVNVVATATIYIDGTDTAAATTSLVVIIIVPQPMV